MPFTGSLPAVALGGAWHYRVPLRVAGSLVWSVAARRRRSFALDARRAAQALPHLVVGAEHIPESGACLVLCNHYTRPGLGAWWIALSVTSVVTAHRLAGASVDMHWVMTAGWRFGEGGRRQRVITPLTRWAFARVAETCDFVTMPPMPPAPYETGERVLAVLHTVRLAQRLTTEEGLLGLVPEGRDTGRLLGDPPEGVGDFVALLVATGMPMLPVGIAEEEGRLRLSFGAPFVPEIPFDPQPSEAFGAPLARRGILYAVSHNGSLLVTRNRMAPWLRYRQAQEDVWKWDHDFAMSPGDRLGLFGENMALLVV